MNVYEIKSTVGQMNHLQVDVGMLHMWFHYNT